MSAVRRPGAHRAYLREVSRQTMIIRLQGAASGPSGLLPGSFLPVQASSSLAQSPMLKKLFEVSSKMWLGIVIQFVSWLLTSPPLLEWTCLRQRPSCDCNAS